MNYKVLSTSKSLINVISSEESEAVGYLLGKNLNPGFTVLLYGTLGAGKTQLTKGRGRALGVKNIKSPSFIIVSEHESHPPLIHVDLYRLEKEIEVDFLDLENYIEQECILIVEWAEKWNTLFKKDAFKIKIEKNSKSDDGRQITIEAIGDAAIRILARINLALEEVNK